MLKMWISEGRQDQEVGVVFWLTDEPGLHISREEGERLGARFPNQAASPPLWVDSNQEHRGLGFHNPSLLPNGNFAGCKWEVWLESAGFTPAPGDFVAVAKMSPNEARDFAGVIVALVMGVRQALACNPAEGPVTVTYLED